MKKIILKSNKTCSSTAQENVRKAKKILFQNAKIIDGISDENNYQDLLIKNGKIEEIKPDINVPESFDGEIIDLQNKLVCPGFIDLHVHFRDPGREDEETLHTGADAAMAGGFTAVCTMPNTKPVTDSREVVDYIFEQTKDNLVSIYPIAAITRGQRGEDLVEMAELVEAGVLAFSDDGRSVANPMVLRRAMEYLSMFNIPVIEHCEDLRLIGDGIMHEGFQSTNLGMPGMPAIAEDIIVARDIMLAELTKCKLHIAHVSSAGAVELIRRAKDKGIPVTAEVAPHHFTLTDKAIQAFDSNFKMNPPLRSEEHVKAIIEGLKDGTIDTIATDHAPHSIEEKDAEFAVAPFGIIGLETSLGIVNKQLVQTGVLTWAQVIEKMSLNGYRVLGLPTPQIKKGEIANLTIIDPEALWTVDKNKLKSKSTNTPFDGWELPGQTVYCVNNGLFYKK